MAGKSPETEQKICRPGEVLTAESKRKRLLMMMSGVLAIFFTGFAHIWGVYQPYVMELAGWTQGQASLCFYLTNASFVLGNIFGGRLQDKQEPRRIVCLGGALAAAGTVLAAFAVQGAPVLMYLTYGLMMGVGQGMLYAAILATAQKWFPTRPGFASGIIVTANGLCGLIMAPISRSLLEQAGLRAAFLAVGGGMVAAWLISSVLFSMPEGLPTAVRKTADTQRQYTSAEMLRSRKYYYLLLTMYCGLLSYYFISPVSQSYQIQLGIPSQLAISAVMIGSVVNAGTRLTLPTLADRLGRIPCVRLILAVAVVAMTVLSQSQSWPVTVAMIAIYGCFGGIMGSFPALTSSIFGMKHAGENYGYVMLAIMMSSFSAPVISGAVSNMQNVFLLGAGFAVTSLVFLQLLQRELKREKQ